MANLMLHQGSSSVDREELGNVLTPPATRSWQPIAHNHLLTTVENQLDRFGYQVTGQSHGLSRNGNRYFGLLEIENGDQAADYRCVIGLRNSHDKTFPAGICVGSCVMICDNLVFAGEIVLARKHTPFIIRDLPILVRDCIGQFKNLFGTQENRTPVQKKSRLVINAPEKGSFSVRIDRFTRLCYKPERALQRLVYTQLIAVWPISGSIDCVINKKMIFMEINRILTIALILPALLFVHVAFMTVAERSSAAPATAVSTEGETDHFWYRLAPADPYIDSQRDNKAFGFSDGKIVLSEDNARTWAHSSEFPNAKNITFSCILKNGNILFATRTRLYLSTDNLKTHRQIIVKDQDGRDYLPHTPANPSRPGWYFHSLDGVHTWDVEGKEMLVWGNYCNVLGGPVPVNIYYSTDQGQTVKIAYAFGHNPSFHDRDAKTGAPLGDPDNPVICRHIHSVSYNPAENAFYACTGDHDRGNHHECHWLRGTYDGKEDSWKWKVLVSVNSNSRYKSGGINFVDGQLYWASDANGNNGKLPHDRGIFRCDPADLADPKKHTMLFNSKYESANMIIEDGVIMSSHYAPASPYHTGFIISTDMGKTWAQYDLKQFGRRSPVRFHKKNSDGWFRVDLRTGWIGRGEILFIKPKQSLGD